MDLRTRENRRKLLGMTLAEAAHHVASADPDPEAVFRVARHLRALYRGEDLILHEQRIYDWNPSVRGRDQ